MAESKALRSQSSRSPYTDAEVELGLTQLARNSGNAAKTSRELKVPESTLKLWRKNNQPRYLEIQEQVIPQIRAKVAERAAEIADQAAEVEEEALALLRAKLPDMDARDVSGAMRNISTTKGISLTHLNTYQAPPNDGRNSSGIEEVFKGLERLGLLAKPDQVDAKAEVIEDAEVVAGA